MSDTCDHSKVYTFRENFGFQPIQSHRCMWCELDRLRAEVSRLGGELATARDALTTQGQRLGNVIAQRDAEELVRKGVSTLLDATEKALKWALADGISYDGGYFFRRIEGERECIEARADLRPVLEVLLEGERKPPAPRHPFGGINQGPLLHPKEGHRDGDMVYRKGRWRNEPEGGRLGSPAGRGMEGDGTADEESER